jgi:hypothetical protein
MKRGSDSLGLVVQDVYGLILNGRVGVLDQHVRNGVVSAALASFAEVVPTNVP